MGSLLFVSENWEAVRKAGWGSKTVLIPLFIILASIVVSSILNGDGLGGRIAPVILGTFLMVVYAASRVIGASIFQMLLPFAVIGIVADITIAVLFPGNLAGGLITNSAASAGFIIFGVLANRGSRQWLLCAAAVIAILSIGELEGMFVVAVIGLTVILRRDFSRWFWVTCGVAATLVIVGSSVATPIYAGTHNLAALRDLISGNTPVNNSSLDALTTGRWTINTNVIRNIAPFGHGLTLTVGSGTAHNIPLVIVDQIGILAGAAWLFLTLYCLVRTRWRYIWVAVIAMSVFDHYLWTQFLPYWWALVGVTTTTSIDSDRIFGTERRREVVAAAI